MPAAVFTTCVAHANCPLRAKMFRVMGAVRHLRVRGAASAPPAATLPRSHVATYTSLPRTQRRAMQRLVRHDARRIMGLLNRRVAAAQRRMASSDKPGPSREELMEELERHAERARAKLAPAYGNAKPARASSRAAAAEASAATEGAEGVGNVAAAAEEAATEKAAATRTLAQQPQFGGGLGNRPTAGRKVRGYLAGADGGEAPAIGPFMQAFAAVLGVSVFLLYVGAAGAADLRVCCV